MTSEVPHRVMRQTGSDALTEFSAPTGSAVGSTNRREITNSDDAIRAASLWPIDTSCRPGACGKGQTLALEPVGQVSTKARQQAGRTAVAAAARPARKRQP